MCVRAEGLPDPPPRATSASFERLDGLLVELVETVRSFDGGVADADEVALRCLVRRVRAAESALGSVLSVVAERAAVLADSGQGPGARELLLDDGSNVHGRQAGIEAARAELFRTVPSASELLAAGRISLGHVDVLARQLLRLTDKQRSRLSTAELLAAAERLPVDTFARSVGRAVAAVETSPDPGSVDEPTDTKRAASWFRHWFDEGTGMGHFTGRLDPERYEALTTAIDAHTTALANKADGTSKKDANLAAAALVDLVVAMTGNDRAGASASRGGGRRAHITVVVGADGSAQTGDGRALGADALRRLLCDAVIQRVLLDERGLPINVGRKHRTATEAQWVAMRAMYHSCAWHLCQRPLSWCQLHHVHEWENGGRTDLNNLVPLCSEHHHRVHEGRWSMRLHEDRSLTIIRPDGKHHATTDPPQR